MRIINCICRVFYSNSVQLYLYYYFHVGSENEALKSVMCDVIKIRIKGGIIYLFLRVSFPSSPFISPFKTYFYDVTHDTFQRLQKTANYRVAALLGIKSVVLSHIRSEEAYLFSRVLFNTLGRHVRAIFRMISLVYLCQIYLLQVPSSFFSTEALL